MESIEIRDATKTDIKQLYHWFYNPAVFFLSDPSLKYPFHLEDWLRLSMKRRFIVLVANELPIGIIIVSQSKSNILISHLYIEKKNRRMGNAKKLIEHVLKENCPTRVKLMVQQREHIQLFKKMGFKKTDLTETYLFEKTEEIFDLYLRSHS